MIEWLTVESSNINSVGWDNNNLYVKYISGTKYLYEGVDKDTFLKLVGSKSRGHFMYEHIKPFYKCTKLTD